MSLQRKTVIFVSGVALAAWFSAAMTPSRPPARTSAIPRAPIDTKGAALAGEITRLRERLRPDVTPREATRNPFVFRSSERATSASRISATAEKNRAAVPVVVEPRLSLTLAGIAEDPGPQGGAIERTAIIAGNGQLFLAKEGDTVTDHDIEYKVGNISANSADLTGLRDSAIHHLVLK